MSVLLSVLVVIRSVLRDNFKASELLGGIAFLRQLLDVLSSCALCLFATLVCVTLLKSHQNVIPHWLQELSRLVCLKNLFILNSLLVKIPHQDKDYERLFTYYEDYRNNT